jgi:hypothetical protein
MLNEKVGNGGPQKQPRKHIIFLAVYQHSQGKVPFSWQLLNTAKQMCRFLGCSPQQPRKHVNSLAVHKNSQEITFSWLFLITAKEFLYYLAV